MSEEKTTTEEAEPIEPMNAAMISLFLERLVPPEKIEIEDIFGNIYSLPTSISARSQIKVIRVFEGMMEKVDRTKFKFPDPINAATLLTAFINISSDDTVMNSIETCFKVAHPKVLKKALSKFDGKSGSAADVFSIEELLSGVVPLFIRLIRKGTGVMAKIS